jgi:archaellin
MSVTHPTAVRTGIADFVVDQLDEGSPPGHLVFQTSGDVAVATLAFSSTAFGAAASGTATAAAITSDTDAVGGTIAKARLKNAAGTDKIICSVTATGGGGDIELSSVSISAHQTVSMSSLTYSAPA